jgi:hypothetical protein
VDPAARRVLSSPRDLWCVSLRDRINTAFARGGHDALKAGVPQWFGHGGHSLRALAVEIEALDGLGSLLVAVAPDEIGVEVSPRAPMPPM